MGGARARLPFVADGSEPALPPLPGALHRGWRLAGEFTVRDKNGNVVEEAEFGGPPHVFVMQELAEVCE